MKKFLGAVVGGLIGARYLVRGLIGYESETSVIDPHGYGRFDGPMTPAQSILIGVIVLVGTTYWVWKSKPQKTREAE